MCCVGENEDPRILTRLYIKVHCASGRDLTGGIVLARRDSHRGVMPSGAAGNRAMMRGMRQRPSSGPKVEKLWLMRDSAQRCGKMPPRLSAENGCNQEQGGLGHRCISIPASTALQPHTANKQLLPIRFLPSINSFCNGHSPASNPNKASRKSGSSSQRQQLDTRPFSTSASGAITASIATYRRLPLTN